MIESEIEAEIDKRLLLLDVEMAERAYQAADAAYERAERRRDEAFDDLLAAKKAAGIKP